MIDEEESSLSTRGVLNPYAEDRRRQDRQHDLEDLQSDTESEYEPSITENMTRSYPPVPIPPTHNHDNDSDSDSESESDETR